MRTRESKTEMDRGDGFSLVTQDCTSWKGLPEPELVPECPLEAWRQWPTVAEGGALAVRTRCMRGGHAGRNLSGSQSWDHMRIPPATSDLSPSGLKGFTDTPLGHSQLPVQVVLIHGTWYVLWPTMWPWPMFVNAPHKVGQK